MIHENWRNYSDQWQVGKNPSLRLNIFGGKNSGHKRKQMERQKSIMVLSEEMVVLISILIKIIQHQEGKNRLLAELMFQQL